MTIPESNKCLVKNLKFEERNVHIDQKNHLGHYLVIRGKDAAYIITWLELNNFHGVNILTNITKQIDQKYDGVINIKNINQKIDFNNYSILMKGSGLIDYLESIINQKQKISIDIKNCTNGILFLPLLYKANKNIKFLELSFRDSNKQVNIFQINNFKIFFKIEEKNIKKNEIKIILSNNKINKSSSSFEEILDEKIIQKNLSKSLKPKQKQWDIISNIAERVFVPESEESRNLGAGGGDAND